MSTTQSNRAVQNVGAQSAYGTDPTVAYQLSVDTPGDFGPEFQRVARDPLSIYNQAEAGAIVDQMAKATVQADVTMEHLLRFLDGAIRCAWSGPAILAPTSSTTTPKYIVPAGGALAEWTLVRARGCAIAGNNGIKIVDAGSDATNVIVKSTVVTGAVPVAETFTAAMGVTLEVCGFRGTTSDIEIDASGYLKSTTLDFTTLGLVPGQMLFVGGWATGTSFATAADRGPARISGTITTHSIPLEHQQQAFSADNGNGKTIEVYFGQTARVVPTSDSNYLERYYTTEVVHPTISGGSPAYDYVSDGAIDTVSISAPDRNKLTMAVNLVGSAATLTTSRKTAFDSALVRQTQRDAVSSATDIIRGIVRSGSTALTGYIQSVSLSIANGVTRNTAHGTLGAVVITFGKVMVKVSIDAFMYSVDARAAIASNDPVAADWIFRNDDGAIAFDIPEGRLGGGKASFPANQVVHNQLELDANRDPVWNTSLILSRFPAMPPLTL